MGELFVDERGQALRVTWHAEPGVVVLSIWRDDGCVGTVRLGPEEAHRLAEMLAEASAPARTARPERPERAGAGPRRFTDPARVLPDPAPDAPPP